MARITLLVLALLIAPLGASLAQVRPQPGLEDPRIRSVDFSPGQVVLIESAPGYQVTIAFAPDEKVSNVGLGDPTSWQANANRSGDRLFVKPLVAGAVTNMTVVTDVRTYIFDLVSSEQLSGEAAYTVRFRYPGIGSAMTGSGTAAMTRYRLSGAKALRPSSISDDGQRTFIEWPASIGLPAVYALDARGGEMLTNGQMREGRFVIDAIHERLVFRIDRQIAKAARMIERTQ